MYPEGRGRVSIGIAEYTENYFAMSKFLDRMILNPLKRREKDSAATLSEKSRNGIAYY